MTKALHRNSCLLGGPQQSCGLYTTSVVIVATMELPWAGGYDRRSLAITNKPEQIWINLILLDRKKT